MKVNVMNSWRELLIFKELFKDKNTLISKHINFESGGIFHNLFPEFPVSISM